MPPADPNHTNAAGNTIGGSSSSGMGPGRGTSAGSATTGNYSSSSGPGTKSGASSNPGGYGGSNPSGSSNNSGGGGGGFGPGGSGSVNWGGSNNSPSSPTSPAGGTKTPTSPMSGQGTSYPQAQNPSRGTTAGAPPSLSAPSGQKYYSSTGPGTPRGATPLNAGSSKLGTGGLNAAAGNTNIAGNMVPKEVADAIRTAPTYGGIQKWQLNSMAETYRQKGMNLTANKLTEMARTITGEGINQNQGGVYGMEAVANTMGNRLAVGVSYDDMMEAFDANGYARSRTGPPNSVYANTQIGTPNMGLGIAAIANAASPYSSFNQTAPPAVKDATFYYNPDDANPKWGERAQPGQQFTSYGDHVFGYDATMPGMSPGAVAAAKNNPVTSVAAAPVQPQTPSGTQAIPSPSGSLGPSQNMQLPPPQDYRNPIGGMSFTPNPPEDMYSAPSLDRSYNSLDPRVAGVPGGVPGRATGQTIQDYENDLTTLRPAGSTRYQDALKTMTPSVPLSGTGGPSTPSMNVEDYTQDPGVAMVPGGLAGRGRATYQTLPADVVQGWDPVSGQFDNRGVPVDPDARNQNMNVPPRGMVQSSLPPRGGPIAAPPGLPAPSTPGFQAGGDLYANMGRERVMAVQPEASIPDAGRRLNPPGFTSPPVSFNDTGRRLTVNAQPTDTFSPAEDPEATSIAPGQQVASPSQELVPQGKIDQVKKDWGDIGSTLFDVGVAPGTGPLGRWIGEKLGESWVTRGERQKIISSDRLAGLNARAINEKASGMTNGMKGMKVTPKGLQDVLKDPKKVLDAPAKEYTPLERLMARIEASKNGTSTTNNSVDMAYLTKLSMGWQPYNNTYVSSY